jgi:hypothetical protein
MEFFSFLATFHDKNVSMRHTVRCNTEQYLFYLENFQVKITSEQQDAHSRGSAIDIFALIRQCGMTHKSTVLLCMRQ